MMFEYAADTELGGHTLSRSPVDDEGVRLYHGGEVGRVKISRSLVDALVVRAVFVRPQQVRPAAHAAGGDSVVVAHGGHERGDERHLVA